MMQFITQNAEYILYGLFIIGFLSHNSGKSTRQQAKEDWRERLQDYERNDLNEGVDPNSRSYIKIDKEPDEEMIKIRENAIEAKSIVHTIIFVVVAVFAYFVLERIL